MKTKDNNVELPAASYCGVNAVNFSVPIESLILNLRGSQVIIDRDLAGLYGVETKVLNQAVKRNLMRFPESFRFQLSKEERSQLVTNCDRFLSLKHSSVNPYAFTEQGVAMLSAVLKSETAVRTSIRIIEAFVAMRNFLMNNAAIFQRLERLEVKQFEVDKKFEDLFDRFNSQSEERQGIFFDGQIFDAYGFISGLVRKAKDRIVLIDNYVDETVLLQLSKKTPGVKVDIFTGKITQQLKLDIERFNSQYSGLTIHIFKKAHDRFLIIDDEVYHIGASLKDLGKKVFGFSKMEIMTGTQLLCEILKKE